MKLWILALLMLTILACGGSSETDETSEHTGIVIDTTGGPNSTTSPTPTITPVPTPVPTISLEEIQAMILETVAEILMRDAAEKARIEEGKVPADAQPPETTTPDPTEIVTGSPDSPSEPPAGTPTPEPPRAPNIQPVSPPVVAVVDTGSLVFSDGPRFDGNILIMSGHSTTNQQPTQIQLWHANELEYDEACANDQPVAFITKGSGGNNFAGLVSAYKWTYCRDNSDYGVITSRVPWLLSQSWTWTQRPRKYNWDPYIWEFNIRANIDNSLANNLRYRDGVGWRVAIFNGSKLISMQWIDGY